MNNQDLVEYAAEHRLEIEELKQVVEQKLDATTVTPCALFMYLRDEASKARPDHLDYELSPSYRNRGKNVYVESHEIKDENGDWLEFFWRAEYGGSEGVYLNIWLKSDHLAVDVATIKTLRRDDEAFREMCLYGAEMQLAYSRM